MTETSPSKPARPWIRIFRGVVLLATVAAIGWMVSQSASQLAAQPLDVFRIGWGWWGLAVLAYVVTLNLSCLFWFQVLRGMHQQPRWLDCLAAFFASQLGKYIPGKAMVVVIRTDLIRGPGVATAPAAASVFVETLTWIFVGSAIASLLLTFRLEAHRSLQVTAAILTVVAGLLTWPAVFTRLATRLGGRRTTPQENPFRQLGWSTMACGWVVMSLGWMFNGLSLWLVLRGLPDATVQPSDFTLTLACVTLATVAGFVSLLPGGMGVRELVIIPLLTPVVGAAPALIAAVVIRLVWLISELSLAGIIWFYRARRTALPPVPPPN